jgi:hypothetical protein
MRTITGVFVALLLPAVLTMSSVTSVQAKGTGKASSAGVAETPKSDVNVTKNADGSVDVTDAAPAGKGAPSVGAKNTIYRPAKPGKTRYADGTVVTRNADGSIDVSDDDTAHPKIQWSGGTPPSDAAKPAVHHPTKKKTTHH